MNAGARPSPQRGGTSDVTALTASSTPSTTGATTGATTGRGVGSVALATIWRTGVVSGVDGVLTAGVGIEMESVAGAAFVGSTDGCSGGLCVAVPTLTVVDAGAGLLAGAGAGRRLGARRRPWTPGVVPAGLRGARRTVTR